MATCQNNQSIPKCRWTTNFDSFLCPDMMFAAGSLAELCDTTCFHFVFINCTFNTPEPVRMPSLKHMSCCKFRRFWNIGEPYREAGCRQQTDGLCRLHWGSGSTGWRQLQGKPTWQDGLWRVVGCPWESFRRFGSLVVILVLSDLVLAELSNILFRHGIRLSD